MLRYTRAFRFTGMGAAILGAITACDDATAPAAPMQVSIGYEAMVGTEPFSCEATYPGIGTSGSTVTFTDFRIYVSDVRLVTASGQEVRVDLEQNEWQYQDVALLDFETGTGNCADGTAETRTRITGTVPAGEYTGLRFALGVPFDKNHADHATAPSPLNISRMFWSWNAGYKFARIDLRSTGFPNGWFIHLGSTLCTPAGSNEPTACANANRPEIRFDGFDPARSRVRLDVAALLAGSDVDVNQGGPAGCMSGPTDGECEPILTRFGIPVGGAPAAQAFFSAVDD